jgi:two-component system LytT family sensor kinase
MQFKIRQITKAILINHELQFWIFQIFGWTCYSLVTFFSITYWDNNITPSHLGHILLQAVLGMLVSWPLRYLYSWSLSLSPSLRLLLAVTAATVFSGLWTALRMATFMWISGERGLWSEFNYWYFGSMFVFISWTALYYGSKYYQLLNVEHQMLLDETALMKEEQFKRLQAESLARDAQLQMLRYQLNPHFLFNTLNSIKALVRLKEPAKAEEMIQLLSQFLRHTLEQESVEKISLEQELASLMLYLEIEKVRFEDRLLVDVNVDSSALSALVPGLILQPLIENSLKYAIAACEEGGVIRFTAHKENSKLCLEVSDTGSGVNGDTPVRTLGVGLNNTISRLEALYENNYSFDAAATDLEGFRVKISLPYETTSLG